MTTQGLAFAGGFLVAWLCLTASGRHVARWVYEQTLGRLVERLAR